jgi:hypothetical protein
MLTAKLLVLVEIELTGEAKYLKVVAVAVVVVAVKGVIIRQCMMVGNLIVAGTLSRSGEVTINNCC